MQHPRKEPFFLGDMTKISQESFGQMLGSMRTYLTHLTDGPIFIDQNTVSIPVKRDIIDQDDESIYRVYEYDSKKEEVSVYHLTVRDTHETTLRVSFTHLQEWNDLIEFTKDLCDNLGLTILETEK